MFRLPSWISESRGCDKVVNGDLEFKMANAMSPAVGLQPKGEVGEKRKRAPSEATDEGYLSHEPKRRKTDATESESEDEKTEIVGADRVRDTIETQFSLEILLKHNELRLIQQELAKCQVALEQLRRCSLIPYPTSQGTPESMLNITNGTGPAVARRDSVPQWAAPYGVTDGPYSRHYAKWLIPDARFDGAHDEWQHAFEPLRSGKTVPEGRSTRNSVSVSDFSTPASKSRSQRGSTGHKLQALSSGYPPVKEKAGPCILKRKDGEWVKLVCIDCTREDFSSTQGFINHCRIAHHRDFKSHEEAAVASGQPVEVENGVLVPEDRAPISTGLVHPLIISTPTDKGAYAALLSRIAASRELYEQGKLPGITSIPSAPATVSPHRNFVESPETPHLSKLLARRGLGVNLTDVVNEAKVKINFDELAHEGESEGEDDSLPTPVGLDGADSPVAMRMPAGAAMSPAPFGRPTSSKGKLGISPRMAYSTPVINTTAAPSHHVDTDSPPDLDGDIDMMASYENLSPNTVASNNAPSLVSDDGEYDEGEEEAQSATSDDEEGSDVAEIDIEDGEGEKVVARTVMRKGSVKKDDKHVTFVSPVKEAKGRTHN
jgi:hypothetical protein